MDIDYAGQSSSVTGGEGGLKEFYILYGFGVEGGKQTATWLIWYNGFPSII